MSEMNQNQENLNNQNTTDNGTNTNPLIELGIKGAFLIGSMFTAYKIGKSSKKEDKGKTKKKLVFRSPICVEEVKEPVEEEVKKEEPEKNNSEKKSK